MAHETEVRERRRKDKVQGAVSQLASVIPHSRETRQRFQGCLDAHVGHLKKFDRHSWREHPQPKGKTDTNSLLASSTRTDMAEKYLSETDIKKLLQCSRCKRVPSTAPIYMCRTGHHECSACYEKYTESVLAETDGSTDTESESGSTKKGNNHLGIFFPEKQRIYSRAHTCSICKNEITVTRNLLAESLLAQLDAQKIARPNFMSQMKINVQETKVQTNYVDCCYNIYGSSCPRYDPQNVPLTTYDPYSRFQLPCPVQPYSYGVDPSYVSDSQPQFEYFDPNVYYPEYDNMTYYTCNNRKDVNDRRSKFNFYNQNSVVSLSGESSKRPIRCPTHLCGRNIAVAALSSHFCFDHPEVPPLHVDFDVTSHLFIDPEMIPFNYGRCVAILLIPNKCDAVSSISHPSIINSSKVKNSLPLVVMASKLDCSTSSQPSIGGIHEESQSHSLNHGDFQLRGAGKSRLLVIWLAGVDNSSSIFTTIQVTEKTTNSRSIIYTGPIMSLRASQSTCKVFEQGDCLVIHSGILENIVSDKGGFDLHVVVH